MSDVMDIVLGRNRKNAIADDSDHDGLINILDCEPYNPRKQGVLHNIGASIARKAGNEKLADKIKARGDQRDKDRAEVREANRESFQKERVIVAIERGKERARQPRGMARLSSGLQTLSKNLGKIVPPSTNKYKGQTMTDFISGRSTKSKRTTMMDVKF